MNEKKKAARDEKARLAKRKRVWRIFAFALLAALIGVAAFMRRADPVQEKELEEYLLSQVTAEEVSPLYRPVLIYRAKQVSSDGVYAAGAWTSGVELTHRGKKWLLTAAHGFPADMPASGYIYKRLRPLDKTMSGSVFAVFDLNGAPAVANGDWRDVVMCEVGKVSDIKGFFPIGGEKRDQQSDVHPRKDYPALLPSVRSIITGKWHEVIGAVTEGNKGIPTILISGWFRKGESGSGFLDEKGQLYILRGSGSFSPDEQSKMSAKEKDFAVLFGPLDVNAQK